MGQRGTVLKFLMWLGLGPALVESGWLMVDGWSLMGNPQNANHTPPGQKPPSSRPKDVFAIFPRRPDKSRMLQFELAHPAAGHDSPGSPPPATMEPDSPGLSEAGYSKTE